MGATERKRGNMTREEAIARIKDHKIVHKMNEPRAIFISEALDMAIEALEQEPKWIPVSERLPIVEYENYLVSTNNGEVDIGTYSVKGWSLCDADGFYFPQHRKIEVVAWMSLPKPYKP